MRVCGGILENVRERVKGGELLSDAFAAQAMVPKIYTTTLMAGEKSGNIDEVLTRYINFQRLAMTFRKKLFVSLIYPTLLVSVVTIMVMFLFTYVVPKFADLFEQPGCETAGDHVVHAGGRQERAEVFSFYRDRIGSWLVFCFGSGRKRIAAPIRLTG